jgi:pimeloyl-ACP methyl ester carboxylesterase
MLKLFPYQSMNFQIHNPYYRFVPQGQYYPYSEAGWMWWNNPHQGSYWRSVPPLIFVLVHGSWADAHFWDHVAAVLRSQGHTVYTPEYAGHGIGSDKNVNHSMITKSVVDFIKQKNLHDIILVGHSFGGTVIQKVAEQIPDSIKRLVFWDAFVLKDGESVAYELPPQTRQAFEQLRKMSNDDTIMLPYDTFRSLFVNTATTEDAKRFYRSVQPEPAKPLFEKLDLKTFYSLPIPKSYVYFYQDNVLPQGEGYGWNPHMSTRLGLFRLIVGDGDHFTDTQIRPAYLAQKIYYASRD